MPAGTTIPAVKQAIIDQVSARLGDSANVQYSEPTDSADLMAENGSSAVVFLDGQIDCTFAVQVLTASTLRIDETYTVPVVVQVLSLNNESLEDCDAMAAELAHGVIGAFAQNPVLHLSDSTELQYFAMVPASGTYLSGAIGDSPTYFGARFTVNIEVKARLVLT